MNIVPKCKIYYHITKAKCVGAVLLVCLLFAICLSNVSPQPPRQPPSGSWNVQQDNHQIDVFFESAGARSRAVSVKRCCSVAVIALPAILFLLLLHTACCTRWKCDGSSIRKHYRSTQRKTQDHCARFMLFVKRQTFAFREEIQFYDNGANRTLRFDCDCLSHRHGCYSFGTFCYMCVLLCLKISY